MRRNERGISLQGLIVGLFILIIVALLGLKIGPPYMEYFSIKKAVKAIAQENPTGTPRDLRRAFDSRSAIDDFKSITAADLEIGKEGNEAVVSFAYRKEVPLFGNIGVYMNFAGSSQE